MALAQQMLDMVPLAMHHMARASLGFDLDMVLMPAGLVGLAVHFQGLIFFWYI